MCDSAGDMLTYSLTVASGILVQVRLLQEYSRVLLCPLVILVDLPFQARRLGGFPGFNFRRIRSRPVRLAEQHIAITPLPYHDRKVSQKATESISNSKIPPPPHSIALGAPTENNDPPTPGSGYGLAFTVAVVIYSGCGRHCTVADNVEGRVVCL